MRVPPSLGYLLRSIRDFCFPQRLVPVPVRRHPTANKGNNTKHGFGGISLLLLVASMAFQASAVHAKDYFLTIGGGYSPTGNQVSLEKNVQLFQRFLAERYAQGTPHSVFFADGESPGRDLQFHDSSIKVPLANQLLAKLFKQTKYLDYQYRSHQIADLAGPSRRSTIQRWFDQTAGQLQQGDKLVIYVTAHGGRAKDRKDPQNTVLYLWNREQLTMRELEQWLGKVPQSVPVVIVMVQCYSGGFANVIFQQGDAKKGLAGNRCGFFATVHNRVAAGCTPDINEANYQEYSSYFWAALRGRTRTGEAIDKPDYDKNGTVTYDEAHAYALLASNTIDVSVKSSDAFLRAHSKTSGSGLISVDTPISELLQHASAAEKAVIEGLSRQLQLSANQRTAEAKRLAKKIVADKRKVDSNKLKTGRTLTGLATQLRGVVVYRWPELNNRWHPQVTQILQQEGAELVRGIQRHPAWSKFAQLEAEARKASRTSMDLDRKWAKSQRLIRTLENVVLAANLPKVAGDDVQNQYQQLLAAERAAFGPPAVIAAE